MMRAYTLYITGLSGAGKTTLARRVVECLKNEGKSVQLIDGDVVRDSLGNMFGYTKEERIKAARVYTLLCKLLNENGIITVVAAIGGYNEIRDKNRRQIARYYEMFLDCSVDKCIERDVKGLYKKALSGNGKNVIGIDEPYEREVRADIVIDTENITVDESLEKIKEFIKSIECDEEEI